jgi:oxygen-independent coproporphyrinogen-3 oxidase
VACQQLGRAGFEQYEISNFAWQNAQSKHNMKYWQREPYLGFGLDAHSMVRASHNPIELLRAAEKKADAPDGSPGAAVLAADHEAVRFASPDSLDAYLAGDAPVHSYVSRAQALEETLFLGLRMTRGVDLHQLAQTYGEQAVRELLPTLRDFSGKGLVEIAGRWLRLTPRGRLLSNEVFQGFVREEVHA